MMKQIYDNIPMLDMNDPDFVRKFKDAAGIAEDDVMDIVTPQFTRTDGNLPTHPPVGFDKLHKLPEATLKAIGCQKWDEPDADGLVLWLYPGDWYGLIPEGTVMECIDGEQYRFKSGETDDDTRYGALAYGFKRLSEKSSTIRQGVI